jgi:DNA (cytosine-5)-methyltransferase 1
VSALYNEIEPYAAAWLRNLSTAGHIAPGAVDARSIRELRATDLVGATQFHTFAGIGAWSYALRLAGWPDDRPVWTGSCPCQPFSGAGAGLGFDDERHLWPEWFRLIRECRPPVVFGEQVASGAGLAWLDVVRADLEGEGYAVGAADLCAAGVGAPHIRQRLFFGAVRVADPHTAGRGGLKERHGEPGSGQAGVAGWVGQAPEPWGDADGRGDVRIVADPNDAGLEGRHRPGLVELRGAAQPVRPVGAGGVADAAWSCVDWLPCRDGKARPVEPGTFPLAHGAPARVGRLRAYGNAIVPQVAAGFVRAFMEATS